jgi:hypothetical protein
MWTSARGRTQALETIDLLFDLLWSAAQQRCLALRKPIGLVLNDEKEQIVK